MRMHAKNWPDDLSLHRVNSILIAAAQALFQLFQAGRQYKNTDHSIGLLTYLPRALPVNFQNHILTGIKELLHRQFGGAVIIPEHFSVFKKVTLINLTAKLIDTDKTVMPAIPLTGARCPCCV